MDCIAFRTARRPRRLAPAELPEEGLVWLDCSQADSQWYREIEELVGIRIHERHVQDSLNTQHPSFFDRTDEYEMLIFRALREDGEGLVIAASTVALFMIGRFLVTVRPDNEPAIARVKDRLLNGALRSPDSLVGLLDFILHEITARYLALRKPLSSQLESWESRLLLANGVDDWRLFMALRRLLRALEILCEDQADALSTWRDETAHELDTHLSVRLNDVQERIQRVLRHANASQLDIDALVQVHFSAASERTNQIVRMLTVISAIFLPLNLIAGIFGMNFEHMPLEESGYGVWLVFTVMLILILGLLRYFRRQRWL